MLSFKGLRTSTLENFNLDPGTFEFNAFGFISNYGRDSQELATQVIKAQVHESRLNLYFKISRKDTVHINRMPLGKIIFFFCLFLGLEWSPSVLLVGPLSIFFILTDPRPTRDSRTRYGGRSVGNQNKM